MGLFTYMVSETSIADRTHLVLQYSLGSILYLLYVLGMEDKQIVQ